MNNILRIFRLGAINIVVLGSRLYHLMMVGELSVKTWQTQMMKVEPRIKETDFTGQSWIISLQLFAFGSVLSFFFFFPPYSLMCNFSVTYRWKLNYESRWVSSVVCLTISSIRPHNFFFLLFFFLWQWLSYHYTISLK